MEASITATSGELLVDIARELFHGHNEVEHYGLPAFWVLVCVGIAAYVLNN